MKATTEPVEFFLQKFKLLEKEVIKDIINDIKDRTGEISSSLMKNIYDMEYYLDFAAKLLFILKTNGKKFKAIAEHISEVGNKLVNNDPELTETCFIEYGINVFARLFENSPEKCTSLAYLAFCFSPANINSHCRILNALKSKMKENLGMYTYTVSRLIDCEECDLGDQELYDTYY